METDISNFLLQCGFSPKHYGYRYLQKAIRIYIANGLDVRILGSELYEFLSMLEGGKSPKTIEKNITTAIEWAYLKGDMNFLEKNDMYGFNERGRPTNSEFIALAATKIAYMELHKRIDSREKLGRTL